MYLDEARREREEANLELQRAQEAEEKARMARERAEERAREFEAKMKVSCVWALQRWLGIDSVCGRYRSC